jgi:predicted chitinase
VWSMPHPDELAPPARERLFREMVGDGWTYREIAAATGLTDYTVARICSGLDLVPSRRDLTADWPATWSQS